MNKKVVALILANSFILAVPQYSYSRPAFLVSYSTGVDYKMENIIDVKPKHWAYNAVKYVLEDLNIMEPKTPTRFMGDKTATRYELARTFFNAVKGLEDISEKDLRLNAVPLGNTLTDVTNDNKSIVNSVVNEYGIMQLMPDNRFMGNREMTRYELAYDLNNYLLLLEKKIGVPEIAPRDRLSQLSDVSSSHWAYQAVKNIVDVDKIMDGYPHNVFGGDQKLTRYEVAAIIKRFVEFIDKNILSIRPTPTPTPTPEPTPVPTPEPTPVPTPTPAQTTMFDLKAGFGMKSLFNPSATDTSFYRFDPGVNLDLNVWFERFGFGLNGEYLLNDHLISNSSRLTLGGTLDWKITGFESDKDIAVILGLGYGYSQWNTISSHGPKGELTVDVPVLPWLGLYGKETFTYYALGTTGWRNDIFAGFNFPVADVFAIQLGYTDTRYALSGINSANVNGQMGAQANLRFRF